MRIMIPILLLVLYVSSATLGFSQIKESQFADVQFYDESNGLNSSQATEVIEDKHGFLWIGTSNGVSRFDGTEFQNFTEVRINNKMESIGFVTTLHYDEINDKLWIGTFSGLYYTRGDKIEIIPFKVDYNGKYRVNSIAQDFSGNLWVVGHLGLLCVNLNKQCWKY